MPSGIVIDPDQPAIIYIADENNHSIRKAEFVVVKNGDASPAPAPPAVRMKFPSFLQA